MTEIEASPEPRRSLRPKYKDNFTFHPKISSNSQRISETFTSDFLSRQQQHVERQKRYYELALQSSEFDRNKIPDPIKPAGIRLPQLDDEFGSDTFSTSMPREHQKTVNDESPKGVVRAPKRSKSLPSKSSKPQVSVAAPISPSMSPQSPKRRNSAGSTAVLGLTAERLRLAKETAEKAIKEKKIFTILGPYPRVRQVLRERGWVEKFYLRDQDKMQSLKKSLSSLNPTKPKQDDDDNDNVDDDDGGDDDVDENEETGKTPPWEEENGFYGIMSRIVRNISPTLIWSLRKDQVDFKFLRKDQIVNHHAKAGSFTTKVGLCRNLRQLPWYENQECDCFFPRCHLLYDEEEMMAFIDDFRTTACMSLIRLVGDSSTYRSEEEDSQTENAELTTTFSENNGSKTSPRKPESKSQGGHKNVKKVLPSIQYKSPRKPGVASVPKSVLETAISQCEKLLLDKDHDIDAVTDPSALSESDWRSFIDFYYKVVQEGAPIDGAASLTSVCSKLCTKLTQEYTQFEVDGYRNIWIVKPGAKSRGRGIQCLSNLDQILSLVQTPGVNRVQNRYIVQKYIERPFLIHKTKSDIRQWFVVTDFNPLTIWWYKDCYVRFCSQNFTLNDFNEAVHLSNNSIQYKYENQTNRSSELPDENMWDSVGLQAHLSSIGQPDVYYDVIYPGMKKAVINAMMCCSDSIDIRKNCFELYGADFMISEDFTPWLLEINASPTMAASTAVTTRLCHNVQNDILKLILDKRSEKGGDVGRFELIYKQQVVNVPSYAGVDLTVTGKPVSKPWNNSTVIQKPIERVTNLLLMEEKRLDKLEKEKERRVLVPKAAQSVYLQQNGKYKNFVPSASSDKTAHAQRPSVSADSEVSDKSLPKVNGTMTKTPSSNLVTVSHRKVPTKVEIVPINTGMPKKQVHQYQPSYLRSKTSSHLLLKPLGAYYHDGSYPPPLTMPSKMPYRPTSSHEIRGPNGRVIMPSSNRLSLAHRYDV